MWQFNSSHIHPNISEKFNSLEKIFQLDAPIISKSSISDVIKLQIDETIYFVKRYYAAGKSLRKFFGRSRVRGEWENLFYFQKLQIPTANVIAYGEKYKYGVFQRGALITENIANTVDLAQLAREQSPSLKNSHWIAEITKQIAAYTKLLHKNNFIHYDLKWRNILVTKSSDPKIYFIDCPIGRKRHGLFLQHGYLKDLYCLDMIAKNILSRTQRLKFYCHYKKNFRLTEHDKLFLSRLIKF